MKDCRKCKEKKELSEFHKNKSSKDGLSSNCKSCKSSVMKAYHVKNRAANNTRQTEYNKNNKEKRRAYREANKENIKASDKSYYEANKDKRKEYEKKNEDKRKAYREANKHKAKKYREDNKERIAAYNKANRDKINKRCRLNRAKRRREDPLFKLKGSISSSITGALKRRNWKKDSNTFAILGCSVEELISHLNNNKYGFKYGNDNLNIDHIVPTSKATTKEELIKLNHYTNLQLLPSEYNKHIKSDKDWSESDFESWLINNTQK